ncbi:hypothetical protein [Paraburkholderia hospita]|uniref:hypothetical protein n=1 Tax=Paraburkholderia hospita TaxID=169430 RepID=UPI001FCA2839|nr:hypothetical protein [Paraburkholderia hospita]
MPGTRSRGYTRHRVYTLTSSSLHRRRKVDHIQAEVQDARWCSCAQGEKLKAQFNSLDPVRLLQDIRTAQQTLSELAAHGVRAEAASAGESDVAVFLASLSSAWKEGEARPTHRMQPKAKHWWKTRVDPFADVWPVIEGWLIAEPTVAVNKLMERLATMVPDAYASKTQLRTLHRRVKAWRA